jgi:hypothetical protein
MPALQLKPTHKVVQAYYREIGDLTQLRLFGEGTVSPAFAALLRTCAGQLGWTLVEQFILRSDLFLPPNRSDAPEYIVRLVGRVVAVSVETVRIVAGLPALA